MCRLKLLENKLGKDVKAEVLGGVRARVECVVEPTLWDSQWREGWMSIADGEFTSTAPNIKGCGIPSIIAPGQNERVVLWRKVRTLPDEDQEMVPSAWVREGVSHGSGRRPSKRSSVICSNKRRSQGACPSGVTSAITSKTSLGRSAGVKNKSPWYRQSKVSTANWKRAVGVNGIDEATLGTKPPW